MPKVAVLDANLNAVEGIVVTIDNNKTDDKGSLSGTVTVAESVPAGAYTVTVTETADSTVHASATLTVTAKPTPKVAVSPASFQGGGTATLSGTGFHTSAAMTADSSKD
ncbi:hypothetical protein ACFU99_00720 [Streptomyces sp. NPDC057654]|uniref:hypothetical protein n=1 Tax=Streptomyces sp. NPDC057654 TaxID=3346196 RepID=UPI0036BEE962